LTSFLKFYLPRYNKIRSEVHTLPIRNHDNNMTLNYLDLEKIIKLTMLWTDRSLVFCAVLSQIGFLYMSLTITLTQNGILINDIISLLFSTTSVRFLSRYIYIIPFYHTFHSYTNQYVHTIGA